MQKTSYNQIKEQAKNKIDGHLGEAFLALSFIPIILGIARSILSVLLNGVPIVSNMLDFGIIILVQYFVIIASLKLSKGKYSILFRNPFGNLKGYLKFMLYNLFLMVLYFLPVIFYLDFFSQLGEYIYNTDPEILAQTGSFDVIVGFLPSAQLMVYSVIVALVIIGIRVRLFFVSYLLVDKDMPLIDSFKTSLKYSRGNFFRILLFPFTYLLWVLLGVVFIGILSILPYLFILGILLIFVLLGYVIIYLVPYLNISFAEMYNSFLREHEDFVSCEDDIKVIEVNPLDIYDQESMKED